MAKHKNREVESSAYYPNGAYYADGANSYIDENERLRKKLNARLIACNIIIAALCIASVVSLFSGDFWKIEATYTVDENTVQALAVASGGESIPDIDYSALDINVQFSVALSFKPQSLLAGVFGDNTAAVTKMLDDTLANILETAKTLIKNVFQAGLKIAIATALDAIKSDEEIAGVLGQIEEQEVQQIIEELLEPNPDTAAIEENLVAMARAQIEAAGETFTAEMEAEIRAAYNQTITELSDDEGNFSIYSAASVMLEEAGISQSLEDEYAAGEEQLTAAMRTAIMRQMDETTMGYVALAYKIIGGILLALIVLWSILLLSSVLRIFSKKKAVKMWYVILFCALPYLLFVATINILVRYGMSALGSMFGEQAAMIEGLQISASGMTIVSAICVAVLVLMSIFVYGRTRREARRLKV